MRDIWELLSIIVQIFAYILAIIVAYQIIRILIGGSWSIEEVILTIVVLNLSICFIIGGYLLHLNNRVSKVDKIIHGHIQWHKGRDGKE